MRSSARMLAVLALLCIGGCDLVFGVSDDAAPCGDESFASAASTDLVTAEAFSVSWDGDRIVYEFIQLNQQALPDGMPTPIDVTEYRPIQLALAPEGDAMFFTANVEPALLQAMVRSGAGWALDAVVPYGSVAGTPSAAEFGPRRVLVRIRRDLPEVQEYEADGNRWRPVGDVHAVGGTLTAPNLTPSGLDMVYADFPAEASAVWVAHRPSTDAWFGTPVAILPGPFQVAQLIHGCRTLYALDLRPGMTAGPVVRRYDR